jgi:hypothetical protein
MALGSRDIRGTNKRNKKTAYEHLLDIFHMIKNARHNDQDLN